MYVVAKFDTGMWYQALSPELKRWGEDPGVDLSPSRASVFAKVMDQIFMNQNFGSAEFDAGSIDAASKATQVHRSWIVSFMDDLVEWGWLEKVAVERYRAALPEDFRKRLGVLSHRPPPPMLTPAPVPVSLKRVERRCALYRWRDEEINLLYVGVAYDVNQRSRGHARKSPWWVFARRMEFEWLPNRVAAEGAERDAIRDEQPIFNRQHNDTPEARRRIGEYLQASERMDLFYNAMVGA